MTEPRRLIKPHVCLWHRICRRGNQEYYLGSFAAVLLPAGYWCGSGNGRNCDFSAFSAKATAAFGTLFGGILLSLIDFPDHADRGSVPAETVWNLGLIAGPATSVFSLLALGFYLGYRINHVRHKEIVIGLEQRRSFVLLSTTSSATK